jgi:phosphoglycolate phosphatase
MPRHRLAIFDLDGTLLDSLGDIAGAMNRALAACGIAGHPEPHYRRFVGDGVQQMAARALAAASAPAPPAVVDDLVARFREDYGRHLLERTRPYAGVAAALDALQARGLALAVLSNKPEPAAQALAHALLGRWPWLAVWGERVGRARKPDPAAALSLAALAGAAPADCLLVGDSEVDMRTARGAGMLAVGALWGFQDRARLLAGGAQILLERPDALADRLDDAGKPALDSPESPR